MIKHKANFLSAKDAKNAKEGKELFLASFASFADKDAGSGLGEEQR